jgi:MFS family permease
VNGYCMNRSRLVRLWLAVTAATAGAVVMAVELLGARMLSVVFGSSLAVWAGMISVTLMSLALGYFLGGCLSDRFPRSRVLYGILLAACVLTALCPYAKSAFLTCSSAFGFQWGAVTGSATIFALPLVLFGTVGPFAIRLLSADEKRIGTVAGSVYAVSTLGSVAGTLLAGLWLIPRFGILVSFGIVAAFGATVACVGLTCALGWRGVACFVVPMALMSFHASPRVGFTCRAPDGEPIVVRDLIEKPN